MVRRRQHCESVNNFIGGNVWMLGTGRDA